MSKKINIKKVSKSFSSAFSKDATKLRMNPYFDWGMIVALFFISGFAVSVFSYSIFIDVYSEDVYILSEDVIDNNYYNKDNENNFRTDISRLLGFYDMKQVKLEAMLQQGVPDVPNPAYTYWLDEDYEGGLVEDVGVEKEEIEVIEGQE